MSEYVALMRWGDVRRELGISKWVMLKLVASGEIRKILLPATKKAYYRGDDVRRIKSGMGLAVARGGD